MNLFPPLQPYHSGSLAVDATHTLYFEESGNPRGTPVLFLHGGPGVGLTDNYRQLFDPSAWRIIGFDQRGCGQSTPFVEVNANSPAHLLSDIEHLRLHLGIERWHVFGGSWGSTLALMYAVAQPERILSLTLRSIFLMRQREIEWFLLGMRTMRPRAWETFTELLPPEALTGDIDAFLDAYLEQLLDPDPSVHYEAGRRWTGYEISCSSLLPPRGIHLNDHAAFSMARIEAYYFRHHRFAPDDWLLREVDRFRHIPAAIVHGQYDLITPPITAHELHTAWPEAELTMVADAGHSVMEPGITKALLSATERFKHIR